MRRMEDDEEINTHMAALNHLTDWAQGHMANRRMGKGGMDSPQGTDAPQGEEDHSRGDRSVMGDPPGDAQDAGGMSPDDGSDDPGRHMSGDGEHEDKYTTPTEDRARSPDRSKERSIISVIEPGVRMNKYAREMGANEAGGHGIEKYHKEMGANASPAEHQVADMNNMSSKDGSMDMKKWSDETVKKLDKFGRKNR